MKSHFIPISDAAYTYLDSNVEIVRKFTISFPYHMGQHDRGPFVFLLSLSNFGPGQPRRGKARLALWPQLPRFFYPLVDPKILTAVRILVGTSEFIQASTNSSICDPGRKVLILPVIPGRRASSILPGIKGGIPPGFPGGIVGIPPGIQGRIGGIPPRINGGIPPGIPPEKGGIGRIPHLILTWVSLI